MYHYYAKTLKLVIFRDIRHSSFGWSCAFFEYYRGGGFCLLRLERLKEKWGRNVELFAIL